MGVSRVQKELVENGNGEAIFSVDKVTVFEVLIKESSINDVKGNGEEITQKTTQKVTQKILELLESNPFLMRKEMSEILEMSENTIKWQLSKLKQQGLIKRKDGRKNGYWVVIKDKGL